MNKPEYIYWNQQGLIPGPNETEEEFRKRALFCLNLDKELTERVAEIPFKKDDKASKTLLEEAEPIMHRFYGIAPQWTPIFLNNYQLSPWHGGCAWIFQLNEETPTAAFLQLRSQFRNQTTYLGIYNRAELIAHELSHVGRMMFHEPQFEEMLAYRSSSSAWRRWLGPIVQSSKESLFFILLLGLVILTQFVLLLGNAFAWSLGIIWVPLFFVFMGLLRLSWRHRQFDGCLKNLEQTFGDAEVAQALIYRLTDEEIKQFSRMTIDEIRGYMGRQKSFRWQFLTMVLKGKNGERLCPSCGE